MTPHEKAVALLAEALHLGQYPTVTWQKCQTKADHLDVAAKAIAASPALASALELGVAWQMAEAALPDGCTPSVGWGMGKWHASYQHKHTECPTCGIVHQCDEDYIGKWGGTPAEALAALAAALEAAK